MKRAVVYCVVPGDLAAKLHEPLRRHFRDDRSVEVIVECRARERRSGRERRAEGSRPVSREPGGARSAAAPGPPAEERRRIRNAAGRRIEERRGMLVPVQLSELPRRAQQYADRLAFVQRLEPETERAEDADTARLVTRIQAGEQDAFAELYLRYFDRVYTYLAIALDDRHEAEDAAQQVFIKVLQGLPRYERREQPFRAWLFTVVRNHAVSDLRKRNGVVVTEPGELNRQRERIDPADDDLRALDWVSDRDLLIFIERLPQAQRQVLMLRYMLDLSAGDTAAILGRTATDVRTLQHRALTFLKARLTAIGREPRHSTHRDGWRRRHKQARVLRNRRFVLR